MPLSSGSRLGPYEIHAPLGAGGMGEVYRARDTKLGRDVALKILPEVFALDAERLARFEREAKTLAALNHPHIAQIFGIEESGPVRALVMELVEGQDLAQRIARGPVPPDEAAAIARQIAEALEAAHELGIIHRDLKPANVKVRPDGTVKVLDFGLAKALDPAASSEAAAALANSPTITSPAAMTAHGVILGTAAYMAPEQARGKAVDKHADIWAFGCVLYEMLTGRRAFEGEDVSDTLATILKSDPDWTALPADTPAWLRRLLRRCLVRDARQRLGDIRDARIEISDAPLGGVFDEATKLSPRRIARERVLWLSTMAALLMTVGAAFATGMLRVRGNEPDAPVVRATIALPEKVLRVVAPVISPDGRRVVFEGYSEGDWMLWVRPLDGASAQPLPGTQGGILPFWSPDSRSIGFFAGGKLKRVDLIGSPAIAVADAPNGRGGSWGSRGVIVFAPTSSEGLLQVKAAGGDPLPATNVAADGSHRWPSFLPDGRHFLFVGTGPSGAASMFVGDLDDQAVRMPLGSASSHVSYGSPGVLLFVRGNTLMRQPFDATRLETTSEATPIAENVAVSQWGFGALGAFSASATGVLVYATGRTESPRRLVWVDRRGAVTPIALPPGSYDSPSLSPDGRQVALTIRDQSGTHLWIYDLERRTLGKRTFEGVNEFPIWSPDGLFVTFTRGPNRDLMRVRADGTGQAELLEARARAGPKIPTSWSPDGRLLALQSVNDVAIREPDGTLTVAVATAAIEREARFAPGGRWFAYRSNETGRDEVYVQSYPLGGGKWQISTDGAAQPMWGPDGRELFYKSGNRLMVVAVDTGAAFRAGPPRVLFEMPLPESVPGDPSRYGVAPDGNRFLVLTTAPGEADNVAPPFQLLLNWPAIGLHIPR